MWLGNLGDYFVKFTSITTVCKLRFELDMFILLAGNINCNVMVSSQLRSGDWILFFPLVVVVVVVVWRATDLGCIFYYFLRRMKGNPSYRYPAS